MMKKLLLPLLLLACSPSLRAQLNPPSLPAEDEFNSGFNWDIGQSTRLANTNAFSIRLTNPNVDLYIATWDGGAMPADGTNGGFLIRQYPAGTAVNSTTTPTFETVVSELAGGFPGLHISSTEAGIIRHNGDIYVILTYFGYNVFNSVPEGGYYYNLYPYDPYTGMLGPSAANDVTSPINFPLSQTDGWIHQDVDDNNEVVVTWMQNGQIYTRAGLFVSPIDFELQGTGIIPAPAAGKPDVAMMLQPNGQTDLYYTFTGANNQQLYVYKANWNQLSSFPINSTQSLPATQLYQKNTSGIFGLPRIDAPNKSALVDDIWSITVANHQGGSNFIFAASHDNGSGLHEQVLNDGSLGSLPDISTGNYRNNRPTVSFSRQNNDLNYAWIFQDLSNGAPTYIGTKTTLGLGSLNNPSNLYFQLPYSNYNRITPAVALSTNNLSSSYLFTSFLQQPTNHVLLVTLGLKTANWTSNTGYKPSPSLTGISENENKGAYSLYPNPFRSGFRIDAAANQDLDITVFNILGQKVYQDKGPLDKINKGLQSIGKTLHSGTYFMELKGAEGSIFREEVVKW